MRGFRTSGQGFRAHGPKTLRLSRTSATLSVACIGIPALRNSIFRSNILSLTCIFWGLGFGVQLLCGTSSRASSRWPAFLANKRYKSSTSFSGRISPRSIALRRLITSGTSRWAPTAQIKCGKKLEMLAVIYFNSFHFPSL